jgi:hypothetical protein
VEFSVTDAGYGPYNFRCLILNFTFLKELSELFWTYLGPFSFRDPLLYPILLFEIQLFQHKSSEILDDVFIEYFEPHVGLVQLSEEEHVFSRILISVFLLGSSLLKLWLIRGFRIISKLMQCTTYIARFVR